MDELQSKVTIHPSKSYSLPYFSVSFEFAPDNVLTVKHKTCSHLRKHKKECALDFMRVKDVKLLHLSLSTRQG